MVKIRVHIFVNGRVQGVFFRQSTQLQAQSQNVYGWIRNLPDGQVEGVFEGEELAVKSLVDYCRHGPSAAQVEKIEVNSEKYKTEFSTFEVL